MAACNSCTFYSQLHVPRSVDDQNYIYGFCFKDYNAIHGSNNTYPVYINGGGGTCKRYKKAPGRKEMEYYIDPKFKCECCKKEMKSKIEKILS